LHGAARWHFLISEAIRAIDERVPPGRGFLDLETGSGVVPVPSVSVQSSVIEDLSQRRSAGREYQTGRVVDLVDCCAADPKGNPFEQRCRILQPAVEVVNLEAPVLRENSSALRLLTF
jgi:hypothetical protein